MTVARTACRIAIRLTLIAALAEAVLDGAMYLALGKLPLPGFFGVAMSAVLLPFVDFSPALDNPDFVTTISARVGIAICLFGLICLETAAVSWINAGVTSIGDVSLGVLPTWYAMTWAVLGVAKLRIK